MNLLHMHCNELIAMRLKELTDTLNKIANQGTHDTNNTIIITAVISVVLALVACICITMYINRKYPKKKPDNNNQTNSNQGNTKNEEKLIAQYLDFIKEETISYEKILKELDRRKKRSDLFEKLQNAFDAVCNESMPSIPSSLTIKLLALQKAIDDLEALDKESHITSDNLESIRNKMEVFNNNILNSPYLSKIDSFLQKGETSESAEPNKKG